MPPSDPRPQHTVALGADTITVRAGANLRKALLKAGLTPHNRGARWVNCHGFGTCGTCAVSVAGAVSPPTRRERWRLSVPPHDREAGLRLACQCRVEGDLIVHKHAGFWGHQIDADDAGDGDAATGGVSGAAKRAALRLGLTLALGGVALLSGCPTSTPPMNGPATTLAPALPTDTSDAMTTTRLFDFSTPTGVEPFSAVDDRVMGGISRSRLAATESGTAAFAGDLSLEQNGGFASVRASDLALDLSSYGGVVLRVLGDGQRYKLRITDSPRFDTPTYQASFDTPAGAWQEIRLPFDAFSATWRGRAVPDASPLDLSRVRRVGLMISDEQAGPFRLELAWIDVYTD